MLSRDLGDPLGHVRRARPPEAGATRGQERQERRTRAKAGKAAKPRRGAPPSWSSSRAATRADASRSTGAPLLIGRGSDAAIRLDDDYVSTRHARDRQLAATSGSSRTSAPPTAPTSARAGSPSPPPSGSASRSASARRSWSCASEAPRVPGDAPERAPDRAADEAALLRDLRRRPGPQGEPGQRVRRAWLLVVATASAGPCAGTSPRATAVAGAAQARRAAGRGHLVGQVAGADAPRRRPDRRARRGRTPSSTAPAPPPRPRSSTANASVSATSATAAAYLCAAASCASSPTTTPSCRSLIDEGRITEEQAQGPPAPQPHPPAPSTASATSEPDLFDSSTRGRRPHPAVLRRLLAACSPTPRPDPAARRGRPRLRGLELVTRQPRGRQHRQRHLRRRRRPRGGASDADAATAGPALVGAAAQTPDGRPSTAGLRGTAPATPARSSPSRTRQGDAVDLDPEEIALRPAAATPLRLGAPGRRRCVLVLGLAGVIAAAG